LLHDKRDLINLQFRSLATDATAPPMSQRAQAWAPLVQQMLRERGRKSRYLLTVGEYPELGGRLGYAAACSGRWNSETGKPSVGDAGSAVRDLIVNGHLYPELEGLFGPVGYTISVDSAEAVMLCPWRQVPLEVQPKPCRPEMRPEFLVPCGASIVYRVTSKD
jgi:hypothetical protein